jgi:acyl-CoA thioesterase
LVVAESAEHRDFLKKKWAAIIPKVITKMLGFGRGIIQRMVAVEQKNAAVTTMTVSFKRK